MVLQELTAYLESQGIGTQGVDLFYGSVKESFPSAVVVLQIYGGLADEPNLGDGDFGAPGQMIRLEYPRIQVFVRGVRSDTDGPFAKANATRVALAKILNTTLSGVYYLSVDSIQAPFHLKTDENFREIYAFNIQVMKAHS